MWRSLVLSAVLGLPAFAGLDPGPWKARPELGTVGEPADRSDEVLARASREIDALVEAQLEEHGLRANRRADDETFCRRAYLDIAGRIPTPEELQQFVDEKSSGKRDRLVDELIESPGHGSRMFHWWADLLRARTKLNNQTSGAPYIHWIKDRIAKDVPYDEMVTELLTSEGPAHQRDNGATGYFMRDRGMPEDNMSNTMRVFLGTRIECAQCHNHPFDRWTQKEYFEMVAYTGGIQYRGKLDDLALADELREIGREKSREVGREARRSINRMLRQALNGVSGSGTGLVQLPDDYQYDDASPEQWILADTLFGDAPEMDVVTPEDALADRKRRKNYERLLSRYEPEEIDSRAVFAGWLTSPSNERFTKVIANRMWKLAFGRGLIEPVDDLRDDTVASDPELLERLERLMVELDYDLDQFLRVLYRTDAWQRAAHVTDAHPQELVAFPGPLLRRMTAEQTWDSLLTLVVPDVDATIDESGAAQAERVYELFEGLVGASGDDLEDRVDLAILRYTDRDAFREKAAQERRARGEERREKLREHRPKLRELNRAKRRGDDAAVARLTAELKELGVELPRSREERTLVRASELESPAPDGHFLQQFGQSNRDQIEAGHSDANVPQALSLLNGPVEQYVVRNPDAQVSKAVARAGSPADKVRAAFRSILGRDPSARELALWKPDLKADPEAASADLCWTLLNTHEFLFIR